MLASGGLMFMSFPAWQMPFGGHQQICRNRLLSHLPFYHLLPKSIYRRMLKMGGESNDCTKELLNIKRTRCSIEHFEHIVKKSPFEIVNRTLYFINPHYEIKFHLRPRRLWGLIGSIPYLRNFFTTSCFYILKMRDWAGFKSIIGRYSWIGHSPPMQELLCRQRQILPNANCQFRL